MRVISWLCILGVGIGVAALVIVLSVMNGFDDAIRKRLISVEPQLIVHAAASQTEEVSNFIRRNAPPDNPVRLSPFESQDVILRTNEGFFGGAQARGLSDSSIQNMIIESRRLHNEEVRSDGAGTILPETSGLTLEAGEVVLGLDLARGLNIYDDDEITVISPETLLLPAGTLPPYEKLKVRAIIRTNVPEVDGAMILYGIQKSMKRLQRDSSRETGVEVHLKYPYDFLSLKQSLEASAYRVESWEDRNKALFYSLKMEKVAMGLFLSLSVLIASFSILTALVLFVTHKRSEIGVLMTMGLSRRRATLILTSVGLVLSSTGVLGGLLFGLLLCWFLDSFPHVIQLPRYYYERHIPVLVDPQIIIFLLLVSTAVALVSSWLPARFITRGTPSQLLRPRLESTVTDDL